MRGDMPPFQGNQQDPPWITPTYGPGWADWSDSLNELVRCRRQGVKVRAVGLCRRVSGTGLLAFILPPDMWPTRVTWRNCIVQGNPFVCFISTIGEVNLYTTITTGSFVSFDIEFDKDQP